MNHIKPLNVHNIHLWQMLHANYSLPLWVAVIQSSILKLYNHYLCSSYCNHGHSSWVHDKLGLRGTPGLKLDKDTMLGLQKAGTHHFQGHLQYSGQNTLYVYTTISGHAPIELCVYHSPNLHQYWWIMYTNVLIFNPLFPDDVISRNETACA